MTNKPNFTAGILRQIAKFGRDRTGQIALTFGLAAVPVVGAAGMAVDYTRKIEAQAIMQAAIDGSAIAATAALNAGENKAAYEKAAQDFFDRNKPQNLIGSPEISIKVDYAAGTLVARTDAAIKTTMTKILGYSALPLTNSHNGDGQGDDGEIGGNFGTTISLPTFTPEHKGEIVFVMDYSGSMNWVLGGERKYKTMRNEAAKLVNSLSQAQTNDYVKFGVVPFSSEVFATMPKKFWAGFTGNQARSSCSTDRFAPHNLSDSAPTTSSAWNNTKFGQVKTSKHWVSEWYWNGWKWKKKWVQTWLPTQDPNSSYFYEGSYNYRYDCSNYSGWRNLKVQDLTKSHNDTYNKILAMKPYSSTHIAVGMEFGFHLLSPGAPFTNGTSYSDDKTEKAVILLTDGAQTTSAFGQGGTYSVRNGEKNLAKICTNMKARGIRIITVSYDLYDSDTETRLKNCATNQDDFYDADNKPALVAAFNKITAKLARDMFLAK